MMNTEKMDVDLPEDELEKLNEKELKVENELNDIREQMHEYKEQLIRARAETENLRKRMDREVENARKFALQNFIPQFLPAIDSIEKGLDISYMEDGIDGEALYEGMTSTLKICKDAFKSSGIEEIDPLGKEFDPELHEAMAIKQVDGEKPNIVLRVFQKGYLLNGRLIRPARVEVSAAT